MILSINIVYACTCASGKTPTYHFNNSEYVALIRVMATELRPAKELSKIAQQLLDEWDIGPEYVRISYEAKEVFKGINNAPNYLMENSIQGGGNCALGLKLGQLYVVFLRKESMGLVTDCTGTYVFRHTTDDNGDASELKLLRDLSKTGR
jgi:hypothetical protein